MFMCCLMVFMLLVEENECWLCHVFGVACWSLMEIVFVGECICLMEYVFEVKYWCLLVFVGV